jgi:hypothetical protein
VLAAAAHNILRDWLTYVSVAVGILAGIGGIYIRVVYPRNQDHKKHEAERAALRHENAIYEDRLRCLPGEVGLIQWWIAVHEKAETHGKKKK